MKHVLLAAVVLLGACASQNARTVGPVSSAVTARQPHYAGTVRVLPEQRQLSARWRITFRPDSTREVRWLLNRGLQIATLTGPHVQGHTVERTDDGQTIVVKLQDDTPLHAPTSIEVAYAGVPAFGSDTINGIAAGWVELGLDSDWHPVFAGYQHRLTADLALELPASWLLATGGSTTRRRDVITLTNRHPLIDIAFAASPRLVSREAAGNAVFFTNAPDSTVASVLATAASCQDFLNVRYGQTQRFPPARILLAPRGGPGYARQNYIVITHATTLPPVAMARFICHEFAHFWSSGAVSAGPENWLNEAFAEYVAARFVRAQFGDVAYAGILKQWREQSSGQPPIWTPTATRRPSARTAYRKAPWLLHQLEERIGVSRMDEILARYMVNRMSTTPALLRMIESVAGASTAAWFEAELAK